MHTDSGKGKGIDSDYLLRLAHVKSENNREALTQIVADLFLENGTALNDRERYLMFDILHKIIAEVETSLRQAISDQLSDDDEAPNDLIKLLANDEIEVAYPILSKSKVLCNEDLIEIIRNRTMEHQLAVSIRESVSCEVSEALVETDNEQVICKLLNNKKSNISKKTMEYLVEKSQRTDSFQEPILHREELEPEMAKQMFHWVSAALRHYIVENVELGKTDIDELIDQATQKGILDATEANEYRSKSQELAEALNSEGMANPEILLKTLKEGEVQLFLAMLSQLTGLRNTLITRIVFESGGEGLAIACKAIGIGKKYFSSIFTLSRKTKPGISNNINLELTRLLSLYDQMTVNAARKVLHKWRRSTDYQKAIRELELGGGGNV